MLPNNKRRKHLKKLVRNKHLKINFVNISPVNLNQKIKINVISISPANQNKKTNFMNSLPANENEKYWEVIMAKSKSEEEWDKSIKEDT